MENNKIAIIGVGYVGLSLAKYFALSSNEVLAFDLNEEKITEYKNGIDRTQEVGTNVNKLGINFTSSKEDIKNYKYKIVTVPTPSKDNKGNYDYVKGAAKIVAENIKKGDIIIFESTYSPYTTRQIILPIIEKISKLTLNVDFTLGYSPERINPGDKINTMDKVTKIISSFDNNNIDLIYKLYLNITPNVYIAQSVEVAESAKILENTQRDTNIALLNQFAITHPDINIFNVVEAMNTKFNALKFTPGLVGGHCISEDPYFLLESANSNFSIIEQSRKVNEQVVQYIVNNIKKMINNNKNSKILLNGLSFKPNVNDVRNSKSIDIYESLVSDGFNVSSYDPISDTKELKRIYNLEKVNSWDPDNYDLIVYLVNHDIFQYDISLLKNSTTNVYDCVNVFKNNKQLIKNILKVF